MNRYLKFAALAPAAALLLLAVTAGKSGGENYSSAPSSWSYSTHPSTSWPAPSSSASTKTTTPPPVSSSPATSTPATSTSPKTSQATTTAATPATSTSSAPELPNTGTQNVPEMLVVVVAAIAGGLGAMRLAGSYRRRQH